MKVLVYRVEHETDGIGPYGHGDAPSVYVGPDYAYAWARNSRNPIPTDENLGLLRDGGWVCGFLTLDQLNRWFRNKRLRRWLHAQGFVVRKHVVHAKKIREDHHQVIFDPTASSRVTTIGRLHA